MKTFFAHNNEGVLVLMHETEVSVEGIDIEIATVEAQMTQLVSERQALIERKADLLSIVSASSAPTTEAAAPVMDTVVEEAAAPAETAPAADDSTMTLGGEADVAPVELQVTPGDQSNA
jgi:hypothetical protein